MVAPDSLSDLKQTHPELAEVFGSEWQTPLSSYAGRLYQKASRELEPQLINAFKQELASMGNDNATIQKALDQIQKAPVLQTSHHITPTHGPTFLALDLICLSGLPSSKLYLIGANSGVAFSNSAWSGALSYGSLDLDRLYQSDTSAYRQALKSQQERTAHGEADRRVSLIPARQRDQLVFGTPLVRYQADLHDQFSEELQDLLPEMDPGQPYSHWSALTAAKIQSRVFEQRPFLIFDINRVISRYLVDILTGYPDHPCSILLSDSKKSADILSAFEDPSMFLGIYRGKKSEKVDPLTWKGKGLFSLKKGLQQSNRETLIRQLEEQALCPGIFLLFFILRFINGIRCLGSFSQVGYLESFRKRWKSTSPDWDLDLEPDYRESLTTGRLVRDGKATWPLDLALEDQTLSIDSFADVKMGEFWQPIVRQLTRSEL